MVLAIPRPVLTMWKPRVSCTNFYRSTQVQCQGQDARAATVSSRNHRARQQNHCRTCPWRLFLPQNTQLDRHSRRYNRYVLDSVAAAVVVAVAAGHEVAEANADTRHMQIGGDPLVADDVAAHKVWRVHLGACLGACLGAVGMEDILANGNQLLNADTADNQHRPDTEPYMAAAAAADVARMRNNLHRKIVVAEGALQEEKKPMEPTTMMEQKQRHKVVSEVDVATVSVVAAAQHRNVEGVVEAQRPPQKKMMTITKMEAEEVVGLTAVDV